MLISICLPIFNGSDYVEAAIESVLAQTHTDFELLIGDDCSDDGSLELVQRMARSDSRLKCWRNPTRLGLFGNYNACMEKAEGSLVKPFAQDDLLQPEALAVMSRVFAEDEDIVLVSCAKTVVTASGDQIAEEGQFLPPGKHDGKAVIRQCLQAFRNLVGEPVTVMFRSPYKGSGFDAHYYSLGDLDYWFRILEHGDLLFMPEPLVTFRKHKDSTTSKLLESMDWVLDFFRLGKQYESYLDALGLTTEEFCMQFVELAGTLMEKMASEGTLHVKDLSGFKEVAYFAIKRCAQLSFKAREYDSVINSTSWRITKPLRSLKSSIGRAEGQSNQSNK